MKKLFVMLFVLGVILVTSVAAYASGIYAITNELGYQGTIWNITQDTGPWNTSTPRNANLYYDEISGEHALLSSWFEHSPSNQNDSFLQLAEGPYYGNDLTITSANGGWDSTLKTFTLNVTGENSPYPWSRFWQPDNGVAWGIEFTDYAYSFIATFPNAAIVDSGYYVNAGDPDTISGSFIGSFKVTHDVQKNPIDNGDLYGFNIQFSKSSFDSDISGTVGNYFGAPVPEPTTMLLLGAGLLGLAGLGRKKFFNKD